jgi:PHD/YefM family antitoxin component YafN of YafNO toxin-antitoxin module
MVVGTANNSKYFLYRCPPTGDCKRRMTIGAEIAEGVVVEHVRAAIADDKGRASVEENAREAEGNLELAQADLEAAIRAFAGLQDEQAARDRLSELQASRDAAQERVDHLGANRSRIVIKGAADWDLLSLDARRALIRATVEQVLVGPGRGADRLTVELVGK